MSNPCSSNFRALGDKYAKIGLPCLHCGETTEQSLEWLRSHDRLFCFACGIPIELNNRENGAYIEWLSQAAALVPLFHTNPQTATEELILRGRSWRVPLLDSQGSHHCF